MTRDIFLLLLSNSCYSVLIMSIREHLRLSLSDVQRTLRYIGQDVFQNSSLIGPTSIHFAVCFFFSKVRLLFFFFLFIHVMFQTRGKRKCNVYVKCGMMREAYRGL